MRAIGLWGLVLLSLQLLAARHASCAFLQNQLPLQVVLATPSELLDNATKELQVTESQAFQAVFSRPVIALGSDFGIAEPPQSLVPFTVNCSVPGLFRWVTTNIARWDPTIEWPTDLDCSFEWNTALKSFDGAPLVLTGPKSIRIKSQPITMEIPDGGITSEFANNVTDKQWNAYRGMKDDHFPEVPPDANITLTFSYPVYLPALQQALEVVSCCGSNAGANQKVKVLPCEPPYVVVDPFGTPEQQVQQRMNSTCAIVKVQPGLPPSGVAILRLPKGVRYNLVSGPTTNNTDIFLWGLRRFRIPLRDNFQQLANASEQFDYQENGISYRRMTLWLPHGLAQGVTADQIKKRTWFCRYENPYDWSSKCNPVPFELKLVNKGQMLMTVPDMWVRQHYWIKIYSSGDVKDAYGLPLEESEAFFFTTEPAQDLPYPELASGSQVMLLEPSTGDKPLDWPVVYRGLPVSDSGPRGVSVWAINGSKAGAVMQFLGGGDKPDVVKSLLGKPGINWARPQSSLTATKVLTLSGRPGLQFVASPTNSSYDGLAKSVMVVQSDLQYAAVSLGTKITHYITTTQGQTTPVQKAKVSLFQYPYGEPPVAGPVCTTDTNGTCTVDLKQLVSGSSYGQLAAVVEAAGHGPLVIWSIQTPSSYEDSSLSYSYVGDLVVDRVIVMPGDKLHVTGYVQERTFPSNRLVLPTALKTVNVTIQPGFKPGSTEPLVLPAQLNTTYGSFHIIIPVPAEAKAGEYSLNMATPKYKNPTPDEVDDNLAEIASVSITVGTPRPPTAVLNITVPDWAPPASTVKVLIQASSYLGADVSGAVIDLSWTVPKATGKLNVTTDAQGKAEAVIPLGKLPPQNATVLGDTLSISAVWIGPTRERITEDVKVIIANGPVSVTVTRSPSTDVPGVPFIMSAQTSLNNKDSTKLEGVTVDIYLRPNQKNSLENCTAEQQEQVKSQKCTVVSGLAADKPCTLTIPCAANLKLVACPVSYPNGTKVRGLDGQPGCSETPVGRNTTDWQTNPWSITPDLGLLNDRQNYTVGSDVTLSWVNAYWRPATGLLVWGNSRLMKQKVLATVPTGPNSITLTLGDECLGGCQAYIVLSLPRPAPGDAISRVEASITPITDLKLPVSKLFDPLMPATESASVTLNVLEDNRLNVTVSIVPSGDEVGGAANGLPASLFRRSAVGPNGKVTPIMRPGGNATIEVKVTDFYSGEAAPDAEVTIVVTDQAILDLLPYPLPDIAADMVSMPSISSFIKELNDYRTTRDNINITYATLERRLKLDPWLPLVTTVSPSTSTNYEGWGQRVNYPVASVVDVSDQDYLKGFTSPLTQTPFYTWGLAQRYPADNSTSCSRYSSTDCGYQAHGGSTTVTDSGAAVAAGGDGGVWFFAAAPVPSSALPAPAPPAAAADSTQPPGSGGKGDAGAALRLSSAFQTTPLFTIIKTTTDGSATVKFKAPPNLSTFSVRAYAVSKGATGKSSKYGGNETQVIVRQPLSLTPSVPKSVRVDDDFEAGVLVSAPDAAAQILVEITSTVVGAKQTSDEEASMSAAGSNTTNTAAAANSTAITPKPARTAVSSATTRETAASSTRGLLAVGDQPSDGSLVLLPEDPMTTSITITPQQQQIEVRFRYKAKAIGASGLRFVARVQTQQQAAALTMESAKISPTGSQQRSENLKPLRVNLFGTQVIAGSPASVAGQSQTAGTLLPQQEPSGRSLLELTAAAQLANEGSDNGWVVADAVQEDVEVQGQQSPVFIATSFSLQAGSDVAGRQEGLVLPEATPGSGSVNLLAGVGYLPAVKVSYNTLLQQQQRQAESYDNPESYVPYGPDALTTALLPAFLARYSPATAAQPAGTNHTNATVAAAGPKALVTAEQLNASTTAAKVVTSPKLTTAANGLLYYTITNTSSYTPTPSVTLNAWAVWLTQQATGGATAAAKDTLNSLAYGKQLRNATATWKAVVASQLVKNADAARNPPKPEFRPINEPLKMYLDFEELSWARLALGPDWMPPKGTAKDVAGDLSLPRQVLAATTPKNMSVGAQARTGLTLLEVIKANGNSISGVTLAEAKSAVDKLTKALLSNIRVSGRTAYVADPPGSASAAYSQDQALALQFLTQQNDPAAKEVLPKLAAYVAGGQANIAGGAAAATCVSVGGTTAGTVASALSVYDASRGSTNPHAELTVTAVSANATNAAAGATSTNSTMLLDAKFTPTTAGGVVNSTTPWSALPPNPRLTFGIQGTSGEISVAAGLEFTPAKLLPFPSYRGLWVERVIQTEEGQGNLLAADLADVVTVTVQLTSPDALSGVVLEVLMPGGLEPVDPNVYKDAAAQAQCDFGGGSYSSWWCPQQSTLRSVVSFTFDYLGAGTVNIKFKAIAATPGEFVLPPVKAYAVQQPELMGISAAGKFTVCPSRRGANAAASTAGVAKTPGAAAFAVCESGTGMAQPVAPAKSCPGNCNLNGVCNINTGVCLCNSGFSGNACQVYQAS